MVLALKFGPIKQSIKVTMRMATGTEMVNLPGQTKSFMSDNSKKIKLRGLEPY